MNNSLRENLEMSLFAVTADADNNQGKVDKTAVLELTRDALRSIPLIQGASDMLRESAKQHRASGAGDGHGRMCDLHADELDKLLGN